MTENSRPQPDLLFQAIADYVMDYQIDSDVAMKTARLCLMDSIGCGLLATTFPECKKLLGPWVPGETMTKGARVLGSGFELDPIKAAFDNGTLIRWLDFNDTWLAAEWGHPSDNLGAILSVADFVSRRSEFSNKYTVNDILQAMIKAYEIQGILALENSFNKVGLDHVILVKVASTAIATKMMGGTKEQVIDAVSHAWLDGQSLRTYRHAPNTGSRKSWAAGDATSRGVRLAMLVLQGEQGYPSAVSAKRWGFQDVSFKGNTLILSQPFSTYVMENILFKISYPAEFHAQTAVECAIYLHPKLNDNFEQIQSVTLTTQKPGVEIISKTGPLHNPADRDHCLQYMVAYSLLNGTLNAKAYSDESAADPRIDQLRKKMNVVEDADFTQDYYDPDKRYIANRIDIILKDGTSFSHSVDFPIGHKKRRDEGVGLLFEKFNKNCQTVFSQNATDAIVKLFSAPDDLDCLEIPQFMDLFVSN